MPQKHPRSLRFRLGKPEDVIKRDVKTYTRLFSAALFRAGHIFYVWTASGELILVKALNTEPTWARVATLVVEDLLATVLREELGVDPNPYMRQSTYW